MMNVLNFFGLSLFALLRNLHTFLRSDKLS